MISRTLLLPEVKTSPPEIQTADSLLLLNKLRFDIPTLDSFIELAARDLCCITGYGANVLLTRMHKIADA